MSAYQQKAVRAGQALKKQQKDKAAISHGLDLPLTFAGDAQAQASREGGFSFLGARMAFKEPNHTQVPNELFVLMGVMGDAELRVVLALVRETLGYHRTAKRMSIRKLARAAGLTPKGAFDGADDAIARGLVAKEQDGGVTLWRLLLEGDASEVYTQGKRHKDKVLYQGVQSVIPGCTPSKKESIKETEGGHEDAPPAQANSPEPVTSKHPLIAAITHACKRSPARGDWEYLVKKAGSAPNLELLALCCETWKARGNKPTNYDGMIDWMLQGGPPPPPSHNGNGANGHAPANGAQPAAPKRRTRSAEEIAAVVKAEREQEERDVAARRLSHPEEFGLR